MHYHIILTELCNSRCKYCYEKSLNEFDNGLDKKFDFDFNTSQKTKVDIKKLKEFLAKDKNPILIFYGGEPLLELEKIKQIMDNIDIPYRMQTNGKLLHLVPKEYLNRITKILISIDGDEERTDYNRGKGTYKLVTKNIELIRKNNYQGELVARMTISEFPDLYKQVLHLIDLGFDSIHWQLDAAFYKHDYDKERFIKFSNEYNKNVTQLINYWVTQMKSGKVLKIYPFIGITESLLKQQKTKLRCGSGYKNYTITTDGNLVACPIMSGIKNFYAGDLNSDPNNLKQFYVSGMCSNCKYLDICGGRCLYANQAMLWPEEGMKLICNNTIHLIEELKKNLPTIKELINKNIIKLEDFEYEKYFGPEIIP